MERIRLTPTRSSSISSRRASAGEEVTDRTLSPTPRTSTASPQQEPDTPRSRESFEGEIQKCLLLFYHSSSGAQRLELLGGPQIGSCT